jgi:hypothetical protein
VDYGKPTKLNRVESFDQTLEERSVRKKCDSKGERKDASSILIVNGQPNNN